MTPLRAISSNSRTGASWLGWTLRHTIFSQWFGRKVENTFGLQVRNDWVHNGLYRTENRVRTDKNDINACNDEPIDACATNPNLISGLARGHGCE